MATFTKDHIASMAERIRHMLEHTLDSVAANRGRIYGLGQFTEVSALSEDQLRAVLLGLYDGVTGMASWLEESLAEDEESLAEVRRHGATQRQIEEDILGAEGECLYRRSPEKNAFRGNLRKLNAAISEVRGFRVKLEDLPLASDAARDAAFQWEISEAQRRIYRLVLENERGTEDQRNAAKRLKLERASLDRRCQFHRHLAYKRQQREWAAKEKEAFA